MTKQTDADIFRAGVLAERRRVLTILDPLSLPEDVQTKIEGIFGEKVIADMFNSHIRGEIPYKRT